jgi:hypothetical protein
MELVVTGLDVEDKASLALAGCATPTRTRSSTCWSA